MSENKLKSLLRKLPLKNVIVFESVPEYGCNTYPVYLELKKRLPHYKMVWQLPKQTGKNAHYHSYFHDGQTVSEKLACLYYRNFAKAFVSSNGMIEKRRPDQVSLFLCHGSKTKKTRGRYEIEENVDYVDVQSHFFDDIITYEYNCPEEKLVYLGYPRCDWLFESKETAASKVQKLELNAARYAIWLPTFRKNSKRSRDDQMSLEKYGSMGMPLVYSPEALKSLNDFLAEQDLCILYKPHPAQDISGLRAADLSHIRIISDRDLAERGLQLYEVLAGSSALITDYSSVYFDYLLLNRPIATTTDDIAEWKQMTGFAFDLDGFYDRSTARCPDLASLMGFLSDVCEGRDDKVSGRTEIRELTNMWNDGNSAKRVADFIMEKIGE